MTKFKLRKPLRGDYERFVTNPPFPTAISSNANEASFRTEVIAVDVAPRTPVDMEALRKFFDVVRGKHKGFRFK